MNTYLFEPLGIQKRRNYLAETAEGHKQLNPVHFLKFLKMNGEFLQVFSVL